MGGCRGVAQDGHDGGDYQAKAGDTGDGPAGVSCLDCFAVRDDSFEAGQGTGVVVVVCGVDQDLHVSVDIWDGVGDAGDLAGEVSFDRVGALDVDVARADGADGFVPEGAEVDRVLVHVEAVHDQREFRLDFARDGRRAIDVEDGCGVVGVVVHVEEGRGELGAFHARQERVRPEELVSVGAVQLQEQHEREEEAYHHHDVLRLGCWALWTCFLVSFPSLVWESAWVGCVADV